MVDENEENKRCNWTLKRLWITIAVLLAIIFWIMYADQNKITDLEQKNLTLSEELKEWQPRADRAEKAVRLLNKQIEEAQRYVGTSYSEMNDALENLETIDPSSLKDELEKKIDAMIEKYFKNPDVKNR